MNLEPENPFMVHCAVAYDLGDVQNRQRVNVDTETLLSRCGGQGVAPGERLYSVLKLNAGGNACFTTHYKADVQLVRAETARILSLLCEKVAPVNVLFSPPLVAQVANLSAYGFQRTLFIDLDFKEVFASPVPLPHISYIGWTLWDIVRKYSVDPLPDVPTEGIFFSGGSFAPPDKPTSFHLFFPGYCCEAACPKAAKREMDTYLRAFNLEADTKVVGLKYTFHDKPLAHLGRYRGDCMRPVYYSNGVSDVPRLTWEQFVRITDPITLPTDGRRLVTWKQPQRSASVPQGRELQALPDRPHVKLAWQYYLAMYAPTAKASRISALDNEVYFISTDETVNIVCPHRNNNHQLHITPTTLTIKCYGSSPHTARVPVNRLPIYLATLADDAPELGDDLAFVPTLLSYLKGHKVGVDTPITVDDFYQRGQEPPAYAVPRQYYGTGCLLHHDVFSALRALPDCVDEDLVQYANLAFGLVTQHGTYLMRHADGTISQGVKANTINAVLKPFQHQRAGAKKPSSFGDTWLNNSAMSTRSRVTIVMEEEGVSPDTYVIVIRPVVSIHVAMRCLQLMSEELRHARFRTVALWWNGFLTALCVDSAPEIELFKEWIDTWCGFTVHGKIIAGTYLQLYDPKGGVGKSTLVKILTSLIGLKNCAMVKDVDAFVYDRWSTGRIGTRLIAADDAKAPTAKSLSGFNELVTGDFYSVEIKGGSQGNLVQNFASVIVASNTQATYATTERDRRCAFMSGRAIFNDPDCPLKTPEMVALFGDTHDSFLSWGRNNLCVEGVARPSPELHVLSALLHQSFEAKGEPHQCKEWLRVQVQDGNLRSANKDALAEQVHGDIGRWILDALIGDGTGGHLFHLSQSWAPGVETLVKVHSSWTHDEMEIEGVSDAAGRYLLIPCKTLYLAFQVAGYQAKEYGFANKFIKAFNGLCDLWDNGVNCATLCKARMTEARAHYSQDVSGSRWVFNMIGAPEKITNCVRFDYSAVDKKLSD